MSFRILYQGRPKPQKKSWLFTIFLFFSHHFFFETSFFFFDNWHFFLDSPIQQILKLPILISIFLRGKPESFYFAKKLLICKKVVFLHPQFERSVSSVGLERLLDRQEVTGSNPVQITRKSRLFRSCRAAFLFFLKKRAKKQHFRLRDQFIGHIVSFWLNRNHENSACGSDYSDYKLYFCRHKVFS